MNVLDEAALERARQELASRRPDSTTADRVRQERVIRLYREMPDAPMPPKENGRYLWGDVEGNAHWRFCEVVVDMMTATAYACARQLSRDGGSS